MDQVVCGPGLCARQPPEPQRHRRAQRPFLGLIASGKAYNDTRQALLDLGLDDAACRQLGIRLHKVARGVAAGGADHAPVRHRPARDPGDGGKAPGHRIPAQEQLYNWRADVRPNVLGCVPVTSRAITAAAKWSLDNPSANVLLRATADLSAMIARHRRKRLKSSASTPTPGPHRPPAGHPGRRRAQPCSAAGRQQRRRPPALVLLGLPA